MRALKDKGIDDLNAVIMRNQKLAAMKRIPQSNADYVHAKLSQLVSYIIDTMIEYDNDGDEIG